MLFNFTGYVTNGQNDLKLTLKLHFNTSDTLSVRDKT